jgi:hypothetical protein
MSGLFAKITGLSIMPFWALKGSSSQQCMQSFYFKDLKSMSSSG